MDHQAQRVLLELLALEDRQDKLVQQDNPESQAHQVLQVLSVQLEILVQLDQVGLPELLDCQVQQGAAALLVALDLSVRLDQLALTVRQEVRGLEAPLDRQGKRAFPVYLEQLEHLALRVSAAFLELQANLVKVV